MKLQSSVLVLGASLFIASCTNRQFPTSGENDDMYATSADAAQAPVLASSQAPYNKSNGMNTQQMPYDGEYDRMENNGQQAYTDEYYNEDYITSRDYKRKLSSKPGYSDGYSDGYSQGSIDNSWSQPIAMGWNSPFNRYNYNSFSPFSSGLYLSYGMGFGGGFNSWNRYSPYGYNSFSSWGNPWMMNSWGSSSWAYSPWGYNSYSPWGYNSFYSPYDYYGGGGGYYNNYRPYYNSQAIISQNAYKTGSRTYGAREAGRNSANYNDRFVNTNRPVASSSGARTSSGVRSTNSSNGSERVLAERRNGTWVGNSNDNSGTNSRTSSPNSSVRAYNSSADSYNPNSRRPASYDSYNRSSNSGTSNNSYRSSNTNSQAQGNTYTRPAATRASGNTNYSSPSYERSSSSQSSSPSRSNSSYSPSSSSSSSSSGGSSRGSSGSSGGSSRGPR